jgi:hypothetical protein
MGTFKKYDLWKGYRWDTKADNPKLKGKDANLFNRRQG